jgi:hypothetical protein
MHWLSGVASEVSRGGVDWSVGVVRRPVVFGLVVVRDVAGVVNWSSMSKSWVVDDSVFLRLIMVNWDIAGVMNWDSVANNWVMDNNSVLLTLVVVDWDIAVMNWSSVMGWDSVAKVVDGHSILSDFVVMDSMINSVMHWGVSNDWVVHNDGILLGLIVMDWDVVSVVLKVAMMVGSSVDRSVLWGSMSLELMVSPGSKSMGIVSPGWNVMRIILSPVSLIVSVHLWVSWSSVISSIVVGIMIPALINWMMMLHISVIVIMSIVAPVITAVAMRPVVSILVTVNTVVKVLSSVMAKLITVVAGLPTVGEVAVNWSGVVDWILLKVGSVVGVVGVIVSVVSKVIDGVVTSESVTALVVSTMVPVDLGVGNGSDSESSEGFHAIDFLRN